MQINKQAGLGYIFGTKNKLNDRDLCQLLCNIQSFVFNSLKVKYIPFNNCMLSLKDIEHALCEFHKYTSIAENPRTASVMRMYRPGGGGDNHGYDGSRSGRRSDCSSPSPRQRTSNDFFHKRKACSDCNVYFNKDASPPRKVSKTTLFMKNSGGTRRGSIIGSRCCDTCGSMFCGSCVKEMDAEDSISFICNECEDLSSSIQPRRKTYWM